MDKMYRAVCFQYKFYNLRNKNQLETGGLFMITAGDFRNGVTFDMDGQVVTIIEFQHVKPGKGAAFVRTKTQLSLREKIWNISTMTKTSITSWTMKHTSRYR